MRLFVKKYKLDKESFVIGILLGGIVMSIIVLIISLLSFNLII